MQHDALSNALTLFDARPVYAGGFMAGGDWAIRFQPPKEIKLFALGRGTCLMTLDRREPVRLEEGDAFLLRERTGFVLASDLSVPTVEASDIFAGRTRNIIHLRGPDKANRIIPHAGADDIVFLGSHLSLGSAGSKVLVDSLPGTIHLKARGDDAGRLHWLIREFVHEACSDLPGSELACSNLCNLLFLHVIRRTIDEGNNLDAGWLRAIFDPRIGPAVRLMHGDPARNWSLPELALFAGMSRTAFATYFKSVAGIPPLTYLTQWRMHVAERRLREDRSLVAEIARAVGYESEAAFSTAFKRVIGRSPKRNLTKLSAVDTLDAAE